MKVTMWGTRGSLATPGPDTARYGGNTACVEVRAADGSVLVLDAGTGIRRLGSHLPSTVKRVDLLLSHLHMDHIQGLGFFAPLYVPHLEVHLWGPASAELSLRSRLGRYLSPPLFPVRLRDLPCDLTVHEVPCAAARIGPFTVDSALVTHPGPTVGYRITADGASVAYLPDHEPALGVSGPLLDEGWTSGCALAAEVDLLIHDAQYTDEQYASRVGWGHSTFQRAIEFAALVRSRRLVLFHHDPDHGDDLLERIVGQEVAAAGPSFSVEVAREGQTFQVGA